MTIPWHLNVELDESTPSLGTLSVLGRLRFKYEDVEDTSDDEIVLTAMRVVVRHEAMFRIRGASPGTPYPGRATIRLAGDRMTDNLGFGHTVIGSSTLAVLGEIELEGREAQLPWTKLASTAAAGSTVVTVNGNAKEGGWRVGDDVVVSTSSFSPAEAETRTISAIADAVTSAAGVTTSEVTFGSALSHAHEVTIATYDGTQVTTAPEVGLLTRNIRIEGADVSDLKDPKDDTAFVATETDQFGARLLIAHEAQDVCTESYGGSALVRNVEFNKAG